jgi:hypothetical protein
LHPAGSPDAATINDNGHYIVNTGSIGRSVLAGRGLITLQPPYNQVSYNFGIQVVSSGMTTCWVKFNNGTTTYVGANSVTASTSGTYPAIVSVSIPTGTIDVFFAGLIGNLPPNSAHRL